MRVMFITLNLWCSLMRLIWNNICLSYHRSINASRLSVIAKEQNIVSYLIIHTYHMIVNMKSFSMPFKLLVVERAYNGHEIFCTPAIRRDFVYLFDILVYLFRYLTPNQIQCILRKRIYSGTNTVEASVILTFWLDNFALDFCNSS